MEETADSINQKIEQAQLQTNIDEQLEIKDHDADKTQHYKIMKYLIYQYDRYKLIIKQKSYFNSAIILGIGSVLLLMLAFKASKERIKIKTEKYRVKDMFGIIKKNDALLALSLAMLLNTGVWVTGNAVAFYYFF